ncbi:hypothetical protein Afil01_19660 [Actinorhabdospora filicis]|uniref:Uncharacterized protein n=1 Tax=Actinorhabdospora filicis TaxID=1785913 RepID=A0A9W6SHD0_9ACTN|nr:hypothetical protein [Actinorhabdospora filicis]GLZ77159.1 hypothetical protein Afil01_19660 [Actinorhabdospora filicis]
MADAAKKPFWRTRKGMLLIAGAIIVAVIVAKAKEEPFPPKPDCSKVSLVAADSRVRIGQDLFFVVLGPDDGRKYTVTLGVDELTRGTPSSMVIDKAEDKAEDKAVILADNLTITGCLRPQQVTMELPFGEYTIRLWDTTDAEPKKVAELVVNSDG